MTQPDKTISDIDETINNIHQILDDVINDMIMNMPETDIILDDEVIKEMMENNKYTKFSS